MLLQRIGVHGPLLESPRFRRRPKRSTVLCAMIAACMALMLIATAVLPQVKTMRSLHNSVHADHASALEVRRDMSTDSVLRAIQHASYAASRRTLMDHDPHNDRAPANPHDHEPPTPPQEAPPDSSGDADGNATRERRKAERQWKRGKHGKSNDCHSLGTCSPPPPPPVTDTGLVPSDSHHHDGDPNMHGDHESDGEHSMPPMHEDHASDSLDGSESEDSGSEHSEGSEHSHSGVTHSHDDANGEPHTHDEHASSPPPPTHDSHDSDSVDERERDSEGTGSERSEPSADSLSSVDDVDDDSYYFMHGEDEESADKPDDDDSAESTDEDSHSESEVPGENWNSERQREPRGGGTAPSGSPADVLLAPSTPDQPFMRMPGDDTESTDTEGTDAEGSNSSSSSSTDTEGRSSTDTEGSSSTDSEGVSTDTEGRSSTDTEGRSSADTEGASTNTEGTSGTDVEGFFNVDSEDNSSTDTEGSSTDTDGSSSSSVVPGPTSTDTLTSTTSGSTDSSDLPGIEDDGSTANPVFAASDAEGASSNACPSDGKWDIGQWNVDEAIGKAWLFYEAQKSGKLPSDHRVEWRGDSYLDDEYNGRDLSGGWFDAGDHLKLMFPMAWSVANMAWAMRDGRRLLTHTQYDGNSNWEWGMRTLEYGVQYLLDCTFEDGEFVAQIGIAKQDHAQVLRAELDDVTPRSVFTTKGPQRPGADMLMQAAAALASSSHVLAATSGSHQLSHRALSTAKDLFAEALKNPGLYSDSLSSDRTNYQSHSWEQYAFWAAAWLYSVSKEEGYMVEAEKHFELARPSFNEAHFDWQNVFIGGCAVMWEATGDKRYEERLHEFARSHLDASNGVRHTPKGLTFLTEWGSLRHAAGVAGIVSMFGRGLLVQGHPDAKSMMDFAERQITYILGASGHSWIVGFGCNPPERVHHRDAALTLEESGNRELFHSSRPNANVITGALVGGPDENGEWNDDRDNYRQNEVALDYNAALLLGLIQVSR